MPLAAPRYSVDDLSRFPADDRQRYELLDGVLLVTPAPALRHQAVLGRLFAAISGAAQAIDDCLVVSPGVIRAGKTVHLEPDILALPRPARQDATWTDVTSWWLAVEVLSPSTRIYDTEWKRQAYQALGVESVWLVDPRASVIAVWEGTRPDPSTFTTHLEWTCRSVPAIRVEVDLTRLFA